MSKGKTRVALVTRLCPAIGLEHEVDLRYVTARLSVLRDIAKEFGIKEGQSYFFVNKAINKLRIVQKRNGLLELITPQQDYGKKMHKNFYEVCSMYAGEVGAANGSVNLSLREIYNLSATRKIKAKRRRR